MKRKRKRVEPLTSGMEVIRGGYDDPYPPGHGCICSEGGYFSGKSSWCGCACGCPFPDISSPSVNMDANKDLAGNC